ncbi:aspartate aminotransferase family protein [Candidatus Woesearchaeota archaeon]|nr:aspartate aminotransferase family protein [Candidatus Woesearchaeota archaeon]
MTYIEKEKKLIMQTYNRNKLLIAKGKGSILYDNEGNSYLDLVGSIATCSVGYANPEVNAAIKEQADRIITTTNLFYTEPQIELAEKLNQITKLDQSFFTNSGAEANETAIKLARKHTKKKGIISTIGGFHGRTLGALSATGKPRYTEPFKPLIQGFSHIPFGNADALKREITNDTAAFIVEPIQGESGIIVPEHDYLNKVREICDQKDILLILDEVQTGNGRTGKYFCYQHNKILPDILTTAKGLANGIPIGATLAKCEVANSFEKGDHASTFGGNPLACQAALTTINYIEKNNLMENAEKNGKNAMRLLQELNKVQEVRGKGLMIGAQIEEDASIIVEKCLEKKLIVNKCADNVLRMLPALTITEDELKKGINILGEALK